MSEYFPEIAAAAVTLPEGDYVLDGELLMPAKRGLAFNDLPEQIPPAESSIRRPDGQRNTGVVCGEFDLLVRNGMDQADVKQNNKQRQLEDFADQCRARNPTFRLSPASAELTDAQRWLKASGGGKDGVMAKRVNFQCQAGNREGMQKIKMRPGQPIVVGEFRYGERPQSAGKRLVGSLLLGLYDHVGWLHHVGFTSGIKAAEKRDLTDKLEKIRAEQSFTGARRVRIIMRATKRSSECEYQYVRSLSLKSPTTILPEAVFGAAPDDRSLADGQKAERRCTMEQLWTPRRVYRL